MTLSRVGPPLENWNRIGTNDRYSTLKRLSRQIDDDQSDRRTNRDGLFARCWTDNPQSRCEDASNKPKGPRAQGQRSILIRKTFSWKKWLPSYRCNYKRAIAYSMKDTA